VRQSDSLPARTGCGAVRQMGWRRPAWGSLLMDPVFEALRVDVERTRSRLPAELSCLADVVWNLAWSWLPDGAALFCDVDAGLWASTRGNARGVLEGCHRKRLEELAADPEFVRRAEELAAALQGYVEAPAAHPGAGAGPVAYFCAEFGIHESLPIYSGGLGILAGDHLKSASDLGIPLVGVGLRYRQGYFQQALDRTGWQLERYDDIDFGSLPSGLILKPDGTPVTVSIPFQGRTLTLQLWGVRAGRVPLLLLDSNREDNEPQDRWITSHLYGGDTNTRISQEMVLGIGGVRALRALGYRPSVFHMNEGHAAFLALELTREGLDAGQRWDEALASTRSRTVFTTHTPVKAGHDAFHPDQARTFLSSYLAQFGAIPRETLLGLGRQNASDPNEAFNMTVLAMHCSRSINGVSQLHGVVSREMFHWLWPERAVEETPIGHITNGVHAPTWIAPPLRRLLDRYLGEDWVRRQADPATWEAVDQIPDEELWEVHRRLKRKLAACVRERTRACRAASGDGEDCVRATEELLDPDALVLGFARRVATYKRLGLLLHDPERALSLLGRADRPVQIVIAGKAHPGDMEAKRVLQSLLRVRHDPRVLRRGTFLVNYDIEIAREMVQGVDVWLNVPRRPLEASGTSGMKASLNGAPNCSVLDGWWAEGYNGRNGWAIGTPTEYDDPAAQDAEDAESLYRTIENEIVPLYYDRDEGGIPRRWVALMKETLKSVGPVFNTDRMLAEYATRVYFPA
jgi:glycogen phosphorylase